MWVAIEMLWRTTVLALHTRIFIACIIAPLPSAVFAALAWMIAGLLGGEVIADARVGLYEHYWWPRDVPPLMAGPLMLFGGFGIGGTMGLIAILVITLPAKAFLSTKEVLAGTDLSQGSAHLAGNVRSLRLAFVGLSVATLTAIVHAAGFSSALTVVGALVTAGLLPAAASSAVRTAESDPRPQDP